MYAKGSLHFNIQFIVDKIEKVKHNINGKKIDPPLQGFGPRIF